MAMELESQASSVDHETWPPPPITVEATDPFPDDLLITSPVSPTSRRHVERMLWDTALRHITGQP